MDLCAKQASSSSSGFKASFQGPLMASKLSHCLSLQVSQGALFIGGVFSLLGQVQVQSAMPRSLWPNQLYTSNDEPTKKLLCPNQPWRSYDRTSHDLVRPNQLALYCQRPDQLVHLNFRTEFWFELPDQKFGPAPIFSPGPNFWSGLHLFLPDQIFGPVFLLSCYGSGPTFWSGLPSLMLWLRTNFLVRSLVFACWFGGKCRWTLVWW